MSTLAEIVAALPSLKSEEAEALERRLHELNAVRRNGGKVFTGDDAVRWWREREHLPAEEAAAFADDVEAAHRAINRPPTPPAWE